MAKTLLEIVRQFVLFEDYSFVKRVTQRELSPFLEKVAASGDMDLIYDQHESVKGLMFRSKLQSSVAAYCVCMWKHAPTVARNVVIREMVTSEPVLVELLNWSTVFLNEDETKNVFEVKNLFDYIVKFRLSGIPLRRELSEAIMAVDYATSVVPQIKQLVAAHKERQGQSSIGKTTKFNWETLWRNETSKFMNVSGDYRDRWLRNRESNPFINPVELDLSQILQELGGLNIIALTNAIPFAMAAMVPLDKIWPLFQAKLPKGLMPPPILLRAVKCLEYLRVEDTGLADKFTEIIYRMFTHAGITKVKGKSIFAIDVSGSMSSTIDPDGNGFVSRIETAVVMAYCLSLVCEDYEIWFSGESYNREAHFCLTKDEETALFKNIFSPVDAISGIRNSRGLAYGGIYEYQLFKEIKEQNPKKIQNAFLFADGEDCDWNMRQKGGIGTDKYPLIEAAELQLVMNVQSSDSEFGIKDEPMFKRIYGNSPYLIELFFILNGIEDNPMEKGDDNTGVSFRNQ